MGLVAEGVRGVKDCSIVDGSLAVAEEVLKSIEVGVTGKSDMLEDLAVSMTSSFVGIVVGMVKCTVLLASMDLGTYI